MGRRLLACAIASTRCAWTWFPAKIVNGDAGCLGERGVWAFFAGKPAPTGENVGVSVWSITLCAIELLAMFILSSLLLEALS
ncbi:hypothetical protein FJD34_09075 [Pseudomonas brenneri]|uniref:Uncharacterized protein n=1 Tax=Pseudomonas brenneri TaxID=129817 RepID=A0A5B2UYR9_9PSED|nr:hypothetical protein F1720_08535 [Pseudomonas brenneri]TWR80422.1 hypothetical protein FJD34_09075 [Pseudomonas brenneri]